MTDTPGPPLLAEPDVTETVMVSTRVQCLASAEQDSRCDTHGVGHLVQRGFRNHVSARIASDEFEKLTVRHTLNRFITHVFDVRVRLLVEWIFPGEGRSFRHQPLQKRREAMTTGNLLTPGRIELLNGFHPSP